MVGNQAQCAGGVPPLSKFEWLDMTMYEQDEKQTDEELALVMGKDSDCAGSKMKEISIGLDGMSFLNSLILTEVAEIPSLFLGIPN